MERALQHLSEQQIESGGYSEDFVGGENNEASSQVIIALTSHGIDPTSEMFTKSQNLVEHLLSFQNEDGGFRHTNDFTRSDGMATEQALQALVAYKFFLEGKGPLYRFTKDDEPIDEEETEEPEEPIVDEEPEQPIDEEETEDSDDPMMQKKKRKNRNSQSMKKMDQKVKMTPIIMTKKKLRKRSTWANWMKMISSPSP